MNVRASFVAAALVAPFLAQAQGPRFSVSFPASVHAQPITGRVFVIVTHDTTREPRLESFSWSNSEPLFGVDVSALAPDRSTVVGPGVIGYPIKRVADIPAGNYVVQAVLNVYTEFHRTDGHTIWAHMDQWEGQHWNRSPGNLYSAPKRVHIDPRRPQTIALSLTQVIPPVQVPPDTKWVKHVKIQSPMLSKFWGQPIWIGAIVLLPRDYDSRTDEKYPTIYQQGHFSLGAPFGFATEGRPETPVQRAARQLRSMREPGYEFAQSWMSDSLPRMIAVTFQHPTPYYDDSYAVNSVNSGPYGDALVEELIPYLEQHFRMITQPWARLLIGGSTGGWEALALQIYHPDFFGGSWGLYPDPVDFRRYQMGNVYSDTNAFVVRRNDWINSEIPAERGPDGMPVVGLRDESRLEAVLGTRGRSGEQLEVWEAAYGPIGADGSPVPLWDKLTGHIDHAVAEYMRDHGYDLRAYMDRNWSTLGPKLAGKLHYVVGDMDNYYLNLAVYLTEDWAKTVENPYFGGTFEYGRPMKPHGWQPWTNARFVQLAADYINGRRR